MGGRCGCSLNSALLGVAQARNRPRGCAWLELAPGVCQGPTQCRLVMPGGPWWLGFPGSHPASWGRARDRWPTLSPHWPEDSWACKGLSPPLTPSVTAQHLPCPMNEEELPPLWVESPPPSRHQLPLFRKNPGVGVGPTKASASPRDVSPWASHFPLVPRFLTGEGEAPRLYPSSRPGG